MLERKLRKAFTHRHLTGLGVPRKKNGNKLGGRKRVEIARQMGLIK